VKMPCSTEYAEQHGVFSLTGYTEVSRGTFKLSLNPPLLITAVNYRTAANKSSLRYDGAYRTERNGMKAVMIIACLIWILGDNHCFRIFCSFLQLVAGMPTAI